MNFSFPVKTHYLGFRMSDEDEESNSMESDPIPGFGNLQVDDKNANCGAQGKHAIRRIEYFLNCNSLSLRWCSWPNPFS